MFEMQVHSYRSNDESRGKIPCFNADSEVVKRIEEVYEVCEKEEEEPERSAREAIHKLVFFMQNPSRLFDFSRMIILFNPW